MEGKNHTLICIFIKFLFVTQADEHFFFLYSETGYTLNTPLWDDATGREYFDNINFMQFMRTGELDACPVMYFI